jgi:DNA repair exonuclease SbcCD ATPase subunit
LQHLPPLVFKHDGGVKNTKAPKLALRGRFITQFVSIHAPLRGATEALPTMKVNRISIKNILGIESLDIEPGSMTVIEGQNGSGKTSALESLKSIVKGGHDATLLRKGATEGEIVLLLDDGVQIRKRVTADQSTTTVKHPEFGNVSKPQAYIEKLADFLAVNPVELLLAAPKRRVEAMLEVLPMKVDPKQLDDIWPGSSRVVDTKRHGLEVIGDLGKSLYDNRTGVNRSLKDKEATVRQMMESLPPVPDKSWEEKVGEIEAELDDLQTGAASMKERILAESKLKEKDQKAWRNQGKTEIEREAAAKIKVLDEEFGLSIQGIQEAERAKLEKLGNSYTPEYERLTADLAEAKARHDEQTRAQNSRTMVTKMQGEADQLANQSTKLTAALASLETLKTSLLSDLPIKGLEIIDGEIHLGGIPFPRLNLAKKIQLVVDIAKLRSGKLGMILIDDAEHLDSETFAEFQKAIQKSKLQAFVTRVSDGPFTVNNTEELEAING